MRYCGVNVALQRLRAKAVIQENLAAALTIIMAESSVLLSTMVVLKGSPV